MEKPENRKRIKLDPLFITAVIPFENEFRSVENNLVVGSFYSFTGLLPNSLWKSLRSIVNSPPAETNAWQILWKYTVTFAGSLLDQTAAFASPDLQQIAIGSSQKSE